MAYDLATVQMLRRVLDEVLVSPRFTRQKNRSALEMAEYILWLASRGEREPSAIKRRVLDEFLTNASSCSAKPRLD